MLRPDTIDRPPASMLRILSAEGPRGLSSPLPAISAICRKRSALIVEMYYLGVAAGMVCKEKPNKGRRHLSSIRDTPRCIPEILNGEFDFGRPDIFGFGIYERRCNDVALNVGPNSARY